MEQASAILAGHFGPRRDISAMHRVDKAEKNCLFLLTGDDYYDLSLDAPRNYDGDFSCAAVNVDSFRCKRVVLGEAAHYRLWPRQFIRVVRCGDLWLVDPPAQRWKLPSSRTIYVAPDGDDLVNDGMVAASPLGTPQLAADLIIDQFDINGTHADIRLLDGIYGVPARGQLISVSKPLHGQNKIGVVGNMDDPSRVVINIPPRLRGFYVEDFGILVVMGMRFETSGLGSIGLFVRQFGISDLGWVQFGRFDQSNPITTWNGSVNVIGPVRLDGNAHFVFAATRGGEIDLGTQNIEIASGLSVSQIFHADSGGRIHAQHANWSALGGGAPPIVGGQSAFAHGHGSQIYMNAATMPGTIEQATADGGQLFQVSASCELTVWAKSNAADRDRANFPSIDKLRGLVAAVTSIDIIDFLAAKVCDLLGRGGQFAIIVWMRAISAIRSAKRGGEIQAMQKPKRPNL